VIALKETELIEELSTKLFNFYFGERNENELFDKINEVLIEKTSKDNLTLKETYLNLFRAYVTYLNSCRSISKNKELCEKVRMLFEEGEVAGGSDLLLLASASYELIQYNNGVYALTKKRDRALNKFRHDFRHRGKRRSLPVIQTRIKN